MGPGLSRREVALGHLGGPASSRVSLSGGQGSEPMEGVAMEAEVRGVGGRSHPEGRGGTTRRGVQVTPRSGKGQEGDRLSPRASSRNAALTMP